MCACVLSHFSCVQPFVTLWTVACQAPLSMEFSRQKYWSGLPCPPPGDLPDPGIEPGPLVSPAVAGRFFTTAATREAPRAARVILEAQESSVPPQPHPSRGPRHCEGGPALSKGFPGVAEAKSPPANVGDTRDARSIPGSGRCPGRGHGSPLQYSCLESPMDRGARRGVARRVTDESGHS